LICLETTNSVEKGEEQTDVLIGRVEAFTTDGNVLVSTSNDFHLSLAAKSLGEVGVLEADHAHRCQLSDVLCQGNELQNASKWLG